MADRLTIKEKYKVQTRLNEDKTLDEISEEIGKSKSCINKYIEDDLIPLMNKISNVKQETEHTNHITSDDILLPDSIREQAIGLLVAAGVPERSAEVCIDTQIVPKLTYKIEDGNLLYRMCIQRLSAHTTMIQKTVGGKEGVTIATQASSQIGDEASKAPVVGRLSQPHIFRPKD